MNPIATLIVDDEPLAREGIRLLLQNDNDFEIVGECANGVQAVNFVMNHQVDLLFLDVQMPEMNGFGILSNIPPERMPVVVFITAFDQYALEAFKVHALDYLLKPYSDEQFFAMLDRVKNYRDQKNIQELSQRLIGLLTRHEKKPAHEPNPSARSGYLSRIQVTLNNKIIFVKTEEIRWIEAADYYVQIHTENDTHLLRETMNRLEEQLDPDQFIRIHRSTIVPLHHIRELEPFFNGEYFVVLDNGKKFKLSKKRYDNLKFRLNLLQ